MKTGWIMKRTVAVAVAAMAVGAALGAAPASAQPVVNGSLSFSGDPGEPISGGQSYAYSTANGDRLTASGERNYISIAVNGSNGDWWTLNLAAPAGQTLAPGTYDQATRFPLNSAGPGLSLYGNGVGCNTLTGSFTIQNIVLGRNGYVQTLDATYEQHCEGWELALRGEVHVNDPPPPAELSLDLAVSTEGEASTVSGRAYITGTVSCSAPVTVDVSGQVTQVKQRVLIRGDYWTPVDCTPGAATPWAASVDPYGTTPFQKGLADVKARAFAWDTEYHTPVTVDRTTVVMLDRSKPS